LLSLAAEVRPILLLVDDLHWLDALSAEALLFALRRLDTDAVACVLTARPGHTGHSGLPTRELSGLQQPEAEQLVETLAGVAPSPATASLLHVETGGNPLALTQLAATLTPLQYIAAQVPGNENPLPAGRLHRLLGMLADDDFDAHFQQAIDLHRNLMPFQQARSQLCYGERLRRSRRRREARVQLRAAIETFDRLDARPWAERAWTELRASGESMAGRDPAREQLTPQELQIALLVAEGRTNREVGPALFLSTRTVEFHLSRAYRKLGLASRTELTRLLTSAAPAVG